MQDEIDLRPWILALVKQWKWLIGAALLGAVAAFVVLSLRPSNYEATSLVGIRETRQILQFDSRIQTQEDRQPLRVFPQLATSDDLLALVAEELPPRADGTAWTATGLRGMMNARAGSDPALLLLTVSYEDAEMAAQIANAWVTQFVRWGNQVYRSNDEGSLLFYEQQLTGAKGVLESAEDAFATFRAADRSAILDATLIALNGSHEQLLRQKEQLELLAQDAALLQSQIESVPETGGGWANQYTVLLMQLQAYGVQSSGAQFQISAEVLPTENDKRALQSWLAALQGSIADRIRQAEARLEENEPRVLALQAERQIIRNSQNRLTREVTVHEEAYTALARKVNEARIASQTEGNVLHLVSESAVPAKPVNRSRTVNSAAVGAVAAMLVGAFLLSKRWWELETAAVPARTAIRSTGSGQ